MSNKAKQMNIDLYNSDKDFVDSSSSNDVGFQIEAGHDPEFVSNKTPSSQNPCKAWSTMVGGVIYMIFPGSVYITGVISTYI